MTTRLPDTLRDSLSDFLADNRDVPHKRFDLLAFLAEAIFCAESNEFHGAPAVSAMLERLDECLDHHRTASEVRQAKGGAVLEWFDAP